MRDQNSQQGSDKGLEIEKGNFTQVPNEVIEYLMNRKKADLTSREYAIVFFLIRELQGWDYKFKPIELRDFSEGTQMAPRHVMTALKGLVEDHDIVKKVKIAGYRTPLYGFNADRIGRIIVSQQPRNYFKQNSKVIDLVTFKVINSITPEVINSITEKRRLAALDAAKRASKDTLHTHKYTLREIHEFLGSQRTQSRHRWESIINRVLSDFPNDELLLWNAIELVNKTRQDLFGNPIKRSILGLFEGDWRIMRVAMQAKISEMQELRLKQERQGENQKKIDDIKSQTMASVDLSEISPLFKRYAMMGNTSQ